MDECKTSNTPLGAHFRLKAATEKTFIDEEEYMKSVPYPNDIGSMMYSMI